MLTAAEMVPYSDGFDVVNGFQMLVKVPPGVPWAIERSLRLGNEPAPGAGAHWWPILTGGEQWAGYDPYGLWESGAWTNGGTRHLATLFLRSWPFVPQPPPTAPGPRIKFAYQHVSFTWWTDGPVLARWMHSTGPNTSVPYQHVFTRAFMEFSDPVDPYTRSPFGVNLISSLTPTPMSLSYSVFTPADTVPDTPPQSTVPPGEVSTDPVLLFLNDAANRNSLREGLWPAISPFPPAPRSPVSLDERSFYRVRAVTPSFTDANHDGVPDSLQNGSLPELLISEVCYADIPRQFTEPAVQGSTWFALTDPRRWSGNQVGGETCDWVEIMNPRNTAVNTAGYYLTDDITTSNGVDRRFRYPLPSVTLAPGQSIVVYCSDAARKNQQTTTVSWPEFSTGDEYELFIRPEGGTLFSVGSPTPANKESHSFPTPTTTATTWYFRVGRKNSPGVFFGGETAFFPAPNLPFTAPFDLKEADALYLYRVGSGGPVQVDVLPSMASQFPALFAGVVSWGRSFLSGTMVTSLFGDPSIGLPNARFQYTQALSEPLIEDATSPPGAPVALRGQLFHHANGLSVRLRHPDAAATLTYTLNGTEPTGDSPVYEGTPLDIRSTTVLRVKAFKTGALPSSSITRTFIHTPSLFTQQDPDFPPSSENPAGLPVCDPEVVSAHAAEILTQLESIPSLALSTDPAAAPLLAGAKAESRISFEYIDPANPSHYSQENAVIQSAGNHNIIPRTYPVKNSWHILFKKVHTRQPGGRWSGPTIGPLSAVFPGSPVTTFKRLLLRSGSSDAWGVSRGNGETAGADASSVQISDPYLKETQRALAGPGVIVPRRRFVHVYLDGFYWGIYDLEEHVDDDMLADHLNKSPGAIVDPDDVKVLTYDPDTGLPSDPSADAGWTAVRAAALAASTNSDASTWSALSGKLDVSAYIDYILTLAVTSKTDHDNRQFIGWKNPRDSLYRLIAWDGDKMLFQHADPLRPASPGLNYISYNDLPDTFDLQPHFYLQSHPVYKILFKERLRGQSGGNAGGILRTGGAFSVQAAAARFESLIQAFAPYTACQTMRWGNEPLLGPLPQDWSAPEVLYDSSASVHPTNWLEQTDVYRLAAANSIRNLKEAAAQVDLYEARDNTTVPTVGVTFAPGGKKNVTITPATASGTIVYHLDYPGTDPMTNLPFLNIRHTSAVTVLVSSGQTISIREEIADPVDGRPRWGGLVTYTAP